MISIADINAQVGARLGSLWKPASFSDPVQVFCVNSAIEDLAKAAYLPALDKMVTIVTSASTDPVKYLLPDETTQIHWVMRDGVEVKTSVGNGDNGASLWRSKLEYFKQRERVGLCFDEDGLWTREAGTFEVYANFFPSLVTSLDSGNVDIPGRTFREWLIRRVMYYYYTVNKKATDAAFQQQVCDMAMARITATQTNRDAGIRRISGSDLA